MEPTPITSEDTSAEVRSAAARVTRPSVMLALVVLFLGLSFFFYNFQFVIVSGVSMLPSLRPDQRILVCKALWAMGPPRRGDVVVVDTEDGFIVKRVAYLPGDEVQADDRPYEWPIEPNLQVPAGSVYVLGDNRGASEDSRVFGPIKIERIVGRAVGLR
jgi:signal peptidase I